MKSVRVFEEGSGRDRYMKGSNLTDEKLHWGQTSVDLYSPCMRTKCINALSKSRAFDTKHEALLHGSLHA